MEQHTEQRRARPAAAPTCDGCGAANVEINLQIDGEQLTMRSCSFCDTRSWHRGDTEVDLNGVLADLSSTQTRYRRDLATR